MPSYLRFGGTRSRMGSRTESDQQMIHSRTNSIDNKPREDKPKSLFSSLLKGRSRPTSPAASPPPMLMDEPGEMTPEQIISRPHSRSKFTGNHFNATKYIQEPITIMLMGMTGAGKSYFIAQITGDTSAVGKDLLSKTQQVTKYEATIDEQRYVFLDTPGFNDSKRGDADILRIICNYLSDNGYPRISGVLYLHCIAEERMGLSAKKALRYAEVMCGKAFTKTGRVVFVSTHWDLFLPKPDSNTTQSLVKAQDPLSNNSKILQRHQELKQIFWARMILRGAKVEQFCYKKKDMSAARIITRNFPPRSHPSDIKLAVETELEAHHGDFKSTRAWKLAGAPTDDPTWKFLEIEENIIKHTQNTPRISPSTAQTTVHPRGPGASELDDHDSEPRKPQANMQASSPNPQRAKPANADQLPTNTSTNSVGSILSKVITESRGSGSNTPADSTPHGQPPRTHAQPLHALQPQPQLRNDLAPVPSSELHNSSSVDTDSSLVLERLLPELKAEVQVATHPVQATNISEYRIVKTVNNHRETIGLKEQTAQNLQEIHLEEREQTLTELGNQLRDQEMELRKHAETLNHLLGKIKKTQEKVEMVEQEVKVEKEKLRLQGGSTHDEGGNKDHVNGRRKSDF